MNEFKVGDKVTVTKYDAWSKVLNGPPKGQRIMQHHKDGTWCEYKVVAFNCEIPVDGFSWTANTLLVSCDYDPPVLVAVNACNLQHSIVDIGVQFVSAGQNVTAKLSDESKREILQAHLRVAQ
jgi:hypothetical protein